MSQLQTLKISLSVLVFVYAGQFYGQPLPPSIDTVIALKPSCPKCPVTVYAVNDDIDTIGATSMIGCSTPIDYIVMRLTPGGCLTIVPNGSVKETATTCIITCKSGLCDTTYLFIPPPTPTADTVVTQPKCALCPDTMCAVNDDVNVLGSTIISICQNPPGYTMVGPDEFGCVILTPNGLVKINSRICVKTCDSMSRCDTTIFLIKAPSPTADTLVVKPNCSTCPVSACAVNDDIIIANTTNTSSCGVPTNYTLVGPDPGGCIVATPSGMVKDTARICIRTCDADGRCDTTIVIIAPPDPTSDSLTIQSLCKTCPVNACAVNDDVTVAGSAISMPCGTPSGYTVLGPDTNGCATFIPNGTVFTDKKFCIVTCRPSLRCDTTYIFLKSPIRIDPKQENGRVSLAGGIPILDVTTNDSINGFPVELGPTGNASLSEISIWPKGIKLDSSTGKISVAPGMLPGVYPVRYQLCDRFVPTPNCAIVEDTIFVRLQISPDPESGKVVPSRGGIAIHNVITNDSIHGYPASVGDSGNSVITQYGVWPTGVTLNPSTGAISVVPRMTPSTILVTYQLCDKLTPANCAKVTDTVKVISEIRPIPDTGIVSTIEGGIAIASVLANDSTNGFSSLFVNSTISQFGAWPSGIALNPFTAEVNVAGGTSPGMYSMTYKLCDRLSIQNCSNASIFIRVVASIESKPDTGFVFSTKGGIAIPNVTANDSVTEVPVVLGPNGNASISQSGMWPKSITLNPLTGEVKVASGTLPGSYALIYLLCDSSILQNCKEGMMLVKVHTTISDTLIVNFDLYPSRSLCPTGDDLNLLTGGFTYLSCGDQKGYHINGPDKDGCYLFKVDSFTSAVFPLSTCLMQCRDGVCDTSFVIMSWTPFEIKKEEFSNYFSPNGDGVNDYWVLPKTLFDRFPNLKVFIYNSWGNIVWRSVGKYKNDFNGYNWTGEVPLPDGVYFYLLELEDKFNETMSGFIELVR